MKGKLCALVVLFFLFIQGNSFLLFSKTPNTAKQFLENIKNKEYAGKIMDLDFENIDLNGIFQHFEAMSGLNFKVDPEFNIVRRFTFKGIEWDRALHLILLNLDLELHLEKDVIQVIKAQPQANRLSIFFLLGVLSALLITILVFIFIHQAKKRKKVRQMEKKYPLPEDDIKKIRKSLNYLFEKEKIYQDEFLSLNSLAERLNIPPHQLSWIINYKIGKSFFDLLNHYRIEDVKKRLTDFQQRNKTILEVAYSSGFNTKSAFNKTFKILTGKTPREYRISNYPKA